MNATKSVACALDANDYYELILTAVPVGFDGYWSNHLQRTSFSNGNPETSLFDRASDSFASDLFTTNVTDDTLIRARQTVNLGAAFDALSSAVTFRIYGYNAEGTSVCLEIGDRLRFHNP